MSFDARYNQLNPEQRLAVDTIEGPVMVVAGPGSGKTELLSLRVANILRQTDTPPSMILCLTFTESAAANMRVRLAGLIGADAYKVNIFTFHGLCNHLLAKHRELLPFIAELEVADTIMCYEVLHELFEKLPLSDPLATYHPEQGYIYLRDTQTRLGQLKKSGFTPKGFIDFLDGYRKELELVAPLLSAYFAPRISQAMITNLPGLMGQLQEVKNGPLEGVSQYIDRLLVDFTCILQGEGTSPLTEWKSSMLEKNDLGEWMPKDLQRMDKYVSLAHLYEQYAERMYEKGYRDFDDLILHLVEAMETQPAFAAQVREEYLYVHVDEFQDTSGVQMKLLLALFGKEALSQRPNVMVVGDDDQAIFKFQGANLSNMLNFRTVIDGVEMISLGKNYRSREAIVAYAAQVIETTNERLTKLFPDFSKELIAMKGKGEYPIEVHAFPHAEAETQWIIEQVKSLLEKGTPPQEIAILAAKHKELTRFAEVLEQKGIPVDYERRQNILDNTLIQEIERIILFLSTVGDIKEEADLSLLPAILSAPFLEVPAQELWSFALQAQREKNTWSTIGQHSETFPHIARVQAWLADLAQKKEEYSLEQLLDAIIGSLPVEDNEGDDEEEQPQIQEPWGFRAYYFSEARRHDHPEQYVTFLSNLTTLFSAIRKYKKKESITLTDAVEFFQLHRQYGLQIIDNAPFLTKTNAVHLMSTHKSKGMEFAHVFLPMTTDEHWFGKEKPVSITLPKILEGKDDKVNDDDKIRLFFVALTRAKEQLIMTIPERASDGKVQTPLRFTNENDALLSTVHETTQEETQAALEQRLFPGIHTEQTPLLELLRGPLANYSMSVTHLMTYLDVTSAGPQAFIERHLLRFPQAKSPRAAFGTAMHKAAEFLYQTKRKEERTPSLEEVIITFTEELRSQRLSHSEFEKNLHHGKEKLPVYYTYALEHMEPHAAVERKLTVHLGEVPLNGKLDRVSFDTTTGHAKVVDLKTGKGFKTWDGKQDYDKIKLWKYRTQLHFYHLLLKNSKEYAHLTDYEGALEFLEDVDGEILTLSLRGGGEELEQLETLIPIVYHKIMNLDFPDVSHYGTKSSSIKAFIDDLLEGKV